MHRRKTKKDSEGIIVKGYPFLGIFGLIEFLFGCWVALSCLADGTKSSPTAGIALALFVLIAGSGLGLMGYSRRWIRLTDDELQIRDFLSRTRRYKLDDIQEVRSGRLQICNFMGRDGVLFRLYDYSPLNPGHIFLLQQLEQRGIRVDVGARIFSSSHFCALRPDPERRHFFVLLSYFPGRLGSRLTVAGQEMTLRRPFRRDITLRVGELCEGRLLKKRSNELNLLLYLRNGKRFLKLSRSSNLYSDLSVTALLVHLSDYGVPLHGLELLNENTLASLRSRYVDPDSAYALFEEEYERRLPLFKRYDTKLKGAGLELLYGRLDRRQDTGAGQIPLPFARQAASYECGIYICLLKGGRMVYTKKEEAPLSAFFPIVLPPPRWFSDAFCEFRDSSPDRPALVFFQSFTDSDLENWLAHVYGLAVKGKILVHEEDDPLAAHSGGADTADG